MSEADDNAAESGAAAQIVPDRQERSASRGAAALSGERHLLPAILLLLALLGISGGSWWLYAQWSAMGAQMADQRERLLNIEGRLSSTHEDLSQSSESVAAGVRELYTEIDKLWGALRRDRQSAEAAALSRTALEERLQGLQSTAQSLRGELAGVGVHLAALQEGVERMQLLQERQEAAQELASSLQNTVQFLERRVAANEEWVEGINAWRPELNERLLRLQEMAENFSRLPAPPATGLQEEPL